MIQHKTFDPSGGYVLHKVTGYWSGRCSAWYDVDGNMLDAEQYIGHWIERTRPVKRNGPLWKALQVIGRAYVGVPAEEVRRQAILTAGHAAGRSMNTWK